MTESLPPVGAEVDLDLRFARRPAISIRGRVTQVRLSIEPGVPAGFGVTFVADKPALARIAALVRQPPASKGGGPRALKVLHVEKNPLLRDMFGYTVNRYFTARQLRVELVQAPGLVGSRAALETGDVAALIVDHEPADGTGEDIVRAARSRLGERPWIVGVGADGSACRDRMLGAGADIYLRKPLVLRDLLYSLELLFQEDPHDAVGLGAA